MSNGFDLFLTDEALRALDALKSDPALNKRWKAVGKALAYLQTNPRHPGLNTHKFSSLKGPRGEDVFEAYAENNTPGAYRIFWFYGPSKSEITVFAITPHP
ncbi:MULTISPECIES: hypothetical protein [unclassified Rhizobium]|uniref:hypothetical protein n=1 Tax=unclassified Rhizobium TaxID=2613769 RepID=UPI001603E9A2|nr:MULTISPECIES: hypothetical protein [unclassified Rhizobium]MBB1250443.1 hypothetical protein [Rhizobium sp. G21]MCV3764835.1 hypothetical protein [Rhizobium sp. TRM95796]